MREDAEKDTDTVQTVATSAIVSAKIIFFHYIEHHVMDWQRNLSVRKQ